MSLWCRLLASLTHGYALFAAPVPVDAASITYVYDDLGRLVGVVDPTGEAAAYSYDAGGNVLSISRHAPSNVSIINFTPNSGPPGATVTISGTGFGAAASQNTVTFNGAAAAVAWASPMQLVVTVPAAATTGPIRVTAPAGSANTAQPFTVTASAGPPAIAGFTPNIGPPGTAVTVTGSNFESNPALDKLAFNTTQATISGATPTTITTHVPSGATSGPIAITTPRGRAASADVFVTADVAVPVSVSGAPVTVTLGTPRQTARLAFEGSTGQRVSLGMIGVTIPGSDVSLVRVDGTTVAPAHFVGLSGNTIDVPPLPAAGRYVILVDPRDNNTGSLTVYLSADLEGTMAIGGSSTVAISRPGQNARLTFGGVAGQQVSLQIAAGAVPSDVSIRNPDGTTLAGPTFAGPSGASINQATLPVMGTYTVLVDPRSINTGSMTLTLSDAMDITGTMAIGGPDVTITTTQPGQNARLTFSGPAGQQVSLRTSTGVGSDISILRPDGTTLAGPSFAGPSTTAFLDQATMSVPGPYTVLVDPRTTNTGSLTLSLIDATDVTGTITIGGATVTAIMARPGQNARLTFSGSIGQHVRLQMSSNTVSSDVSILNPDGTTLAGPVFAGPSGGSIDQATLPVPGMYTVLVNPRSTNTGSMTVALVDVGDVTGTIAIGGPDVTITTTLPGQNARLTFSGPVGQQVSLRTSTGVGSDVSILRPDGTILAGSSFAGPSTSAFVDQATMSVPGPYTVLVDPRTTNTGSLTLSLIDATDVTGTITIGGPAVVVTIAQPGQNARLTFTGSANQPATVRLSAGTVGTGTLSLLEPDGSTSATTTANLDTLALPTQTLPVDGIYTIVIDPGGTRTGNLTVRVTSP
jgi:YD repeat-containing protein